MLYANMNFININLCLFYEPSEKRHSRRRTVEENTEESGREFVEL